MGAARALLGCFPGLEFTVTTSANLQPLNAIFVEAMNRKAVGVLGVLVVFGGGLMLANKGAFVTQVVETEGHRTTEYGLFGGSWPLKREAVPDLKVQEDVVAHLGAVAPWPAQLDASAGRQRVVCQAEAIWRSSQGYRSLSEASQRWEDYQDA